MEEAQYSERRMLDIGRSLLRLVRMNRFRSLQYICTYLKSREHLLDKAAMFIAKTYIVCKVSRSTDSISSNVCFTVLGGHCKGACSPCPDTSLITLQPIGVMLREGCLQPLPRLGRISWYQHREPAHTNTSYKHSLPLNTPAPLNTAS